MIIAAIGLVLGAWLLQQQATLPNVLCWLVPLLLIIAYRLAKSQSTTFNLNNRLVNHQTVAVRQVQSSVAVTHLHTGCC